MSQRCTYEKYEINPNFLSNPSDDAILNSISEKYKSPDEMLFDKLMEHWGTIFPDRNRNAAGPQFFHWIVTQMNPTEKEFDKYNQFYCGVSGSIVSPGRQPMLVKVMHKNGSYVCGNYYLCCWPCACDISKYAIAEEMEFKLSDKTVTRTVLTIGDPCTVPDKMPSEVSAFKCKDRKTENAIHTSSGRIVVAVLHNSKPCPEDFKEHPKCPERNNGNLEGGMGDIFVKLCQITEK